MLSACLMPVPVCTGDLGPGEPLPVCAGAAGPVGTGLISIVLAGAPATAGSVILSSPVSSSRTGLNTGTLGDTPPTPVLTKLTLCLPSSSVVINPRTGKSTEVMPGWMVALPAAARLA